MLPETFMNFPLVKPASPPSLGRVRGAVRPRELELSERSRALQSSRFGTSSQPATGSSETAPPARSAGFRPANCEDALGLPSVKHQRREPLRAASRPQRLLVAVRVRAERAAFERAKPRDRE
jgi:hypothetical protein